MNQNIKVQKITRTAILLAIAIVFQMAGKYMGPNNNFIVGPAVNAVLFVATAVTGLWGGAAISVLAPLISAITNKAAIAPIILAYSPFIAAGNFILVLTFYLLMKKNQITAVIAASVLKAAFLFATIKGFIHFLTPVLDIPSKVATVLVGLFSWPQVVTAVIGGTIALFIIKILKKNLENMPLYCSI